MYERIRAMKSLGEQYSNELIRQGIINQEEVESIKKQINDHFEAEFESSKKYEPNLEQMTNPKFKGSRAYTHKWEGIVPSQNGREPDHTGYDTKVLRDIGIKSVTLPSDFEVHKRLQSFHISNRIKGIENNQIDWATAEAMAMGSLNLEGFNTRIIGEDSERGTFNQRHAVFTDQKTAGKTFCPLN